MQRIRLPLIAIVCLLFAGQVSLFGAPPALPAAVTEKTSSAEPKATRPDPKTKRQQIAEQLRRVQRAVDTAKQSSPPEGAKPPEHLVRHLQLLKQIDVVLAQQEAAQTSRADLATRRSDLEAQLQSVRSGVLAEKRPYSFLLLDRLGDELRSQRAHEPRMASAVDDAAETVSRSLSSLEEKQRLLRQAKEKADTNRDESRDAQLDTAVRQAELQTQLAREVLALRKLEQTNEQRAKELHQIETSLLAEKTERIAPYAEFSEEDLQVQLLEIEKREQDLKASLQTAQYTLSYRETQWFQARARLDESSAEAPAMVQEVEAKRLDRQLQQQQIAIINLQLQRLVAARGTWSRRFKVTNGAAATDELIAWREQTASFLDQLAREKRLQVLRSDQLRQDLATLDKKPHMAGGQANGARRWIENQKESLQDLIQAYDTNIVSIEASRRLHQKLLREIEGDVQRWTARDWGASIWHYFSRVWNMEIVNSDGRPITVGKIVIGLILLYLGFVLARSLSRALGQRLLRRFGISDSGAAAIQTVTFYLLTLIGALSALRFVNVPLTMFTFLGGAVAIGVGFGSQNIVNNFISGLILFAERPIRVGDLIQLDDLFGTVQQIGARSTRILTGNNLEIIVPNSSFLENNVLNLTRADNTIRTCINVGVAYGAPTREVSRLLRRAAQEHGLVLNHPEPFVWFVEFGDNALNFELHFWVEMRNVADRRRIESDIRFKVDQLLRDAGIVIAFPQRDVHLDMQGPLEVRLVAPDTADAGKVRPLVRDAA